MKEKKDTRGTARCADCLFGRPVTVVDKDKSGKETAQTGAASARAAARVPCGRCCRSSGTTLPISVRSPPGSVR